MSTAPTGFQVDVEFAAGVWTNVTSLVRSTQGVSIRYGRTSPLSQPQVASCSLVLDNSSGNFTPLNAGSSYYPNVTTGKRIRVSYASGASVRFLGFINAWQPILDGGVAPLVQVQATDFFDRLSRGSLSSVVASEILALSPTYYIPLSDPAGSTSAGSTAGVLYPVVHFEPVGTTGESLTFGSTSPLAWDSGSWCSFSAKRGSSIVAADYYAVQSPAVTGSTWTVSAAFTTTSAVPIEMSGYVWCQSLLAGSFPGASQSALYVDPNSGVAICGVEGGAAITGATALNDGLPHVLTLVANGGSGSILYVDGVSVGTNGSTATPGESASYIGGSGPMSSGGSGFIGNIAHFAIWQGTALSAGQVATISSAIRTGFAGELTGTRAARILGYAGLTSGQWTLDAGQETVAAVNYTSKSAVSALQDLATAEGGGSAAFVNTDGKVRFIDRTYRTTTTPAMTIDASLDINPGTWAPFYDYLTLVNSSTVTDGNGLTATYADAVSVAANGLFDDTRSTIANSTGAATRLAAWVVNSSSSEYRFPQLTINIARVSNASTLYTALASLTIGSRLRISNIPASQNNASGTPTRIFHTTTLDLFVEGWSEMVSDDNYLITLDLSPADSPARGVWDGTNGYGDWQPDVGTMTLTSNITNAGTTVSLTTAATHPTLSTSAGDYPLNIQIDQEVLQVNSAPAGSASPQSLTCTRAQAGTFADAHTAGAVISLYPVASWTL